MSQQLSFTTPAPTAREALQAYQPAVRDLPLREQPVHRLFYAGDGSLSTSELLAILLGTPYALHDAAHILKQFKNLRGLTRASF